MLTGFSRIPDKSSPRALVTSFGRTGMTGLEERLAPKVHTETLKKGFTLMESALRWSILLLVPFMALSFGGVERWAVLTMEVVIFMTFTLWMAAYLITKKNNLRFINTRLGLTCFNCSLLPGNSSSASASP